MDALHDRYGAKEFKLDHDLFTVNRRKVLAFCDAVQNKDYRWRVSARTDCVDERLLEKMASAGCIGLYFGVESGSKRIQQLVQKRLKLDSVERILDVAENLRIETTVSFITGYPDEDRLDQNDTLDMLGRCFRRPQGACIPQLHILLPEPGTPMFSTHQHRLIYDGYVTKFNARLLNDNDRTRIRRHPELYSTYYYYPASMPRSSYTFAVDAVDAFRCAGHEILSYALRFYDGQLSKLIADFYEWMARKHGPVCSDFVIQFVSDRFGNSHHLTSLIRFGIGVRARKIVRQASAVGFQKSCFNWEQLYLLSPQIRLFTGLHDCGRLLSRIRELPFDLTTLDEAEVGDQTSYMVLLRDDEEVHYRVEPGVETILCMFESARSAREVVAPLSQLCPGTSVREDFFTHLVSIGALIPARRRSLKRSGGRLGSTGTSMQRH